MLSGFVVAKVIAIYAGPSGLAMLGQFQSVIASLSGIVNAPVGNGIVRYTAETYKDGNNACAPWWRASVQWVAILLSIIIPIACIRAESISRLIFDTSEYHWLIIITVLTLPFTAVGTLISSIVNGQQRFKRYIFIGALSVLLSSSVMIAMVLNSNLKGALLAAAVQNGLLGLVLIVLSAREPWFKLRYFIGSIEPSKRRQIRGYLLMAITSALTVPISLVLVRNILVDNVGWEQTGYWQAVWKVSEVYLSVVTMALSTYYLPKLASLTGLANIKNEIKNTAKIILPIVVFMALGIYFLRDLLILVLFTPEFEESRELFLIQLLGDVIKIASWLYAFPMVSRGATSWFVSTEIVFSISFVVLAWFLIPIFNTQGANWAYLINYSLHFIFVFVNLKHFAK